MTPGTNPQPRIRVRQPMLPLADAPVPRVRHRPDPTDPRPTPCMRASHNVPDGLTAAELCAVGEVDLTCKPSLWRGWPNGSLYVGKGGGAHKGRVLRTESGLYHALRWSPFSKTYTFVRTVKTHEAALVGL